MSRECSESSFLSVCFLTSLRYREFCLKNGVLDLQSCIGTCLPTSEQIGFCSVGVSCFLGTAFPLHVRRLECTPWQQVQNLVPSYLQKQKSGYRGVFYTRKKRLAKNSLSSLPLSLFFSHDEVSKPHP